MIKFSIIIPCHNNFEIMNRCLKSLENQTLKDFEVIFIDDKSKDDLLEKLYKYQEKTKLNMTIIENEVNLGPGPSRNKGIENATGEYITFLDSDDYIEENTLEEINKIIEKENPECIIYDYCFKTKNNRTINQKSYLKDESGFIKKEDAMIYSTGSTWCKVYLTSILKENKIKFPNLMRAEDMVFNKIAISNCDKIYHLNKSLYYYFLNENSIMNTRKTLSEDILLKAMEIIEEELGKNFKEQVEAIFIKEYFYGTMITLIKMNKNNKEIKEHIELCEKKYTNLYEVSFINYMPKFQRICLKLMKKRRIIFLRIIVIIKEIIKKIL